jgi:hypothetical protein
MFDAALLRMRLVKQSKHPKKSDADADSDADSDADADADSDADSDSNSDSNTDSGHLATYRHRVLSGAWIEECER